MFKHSTTKTEQLRSVKAFPLWRERFRHIGKDANIDWFIVFTMSMIIGISTICVGGLTYLKVERLLSAPPSPVSPNSIPNIDTETLNRIIQQFDGRVTERATLLKQAINIGDPSL